MLYVGDYGKLFWHVYNAESGHFLQLSEQDFLSLAWLPNGSQLVIENAHAGTPRSDYSLAQVYTEQELLSFYDAVETKGCKLRLFPQGLTPKARKMFGIDEKSDHNDLIAIARYVEEFPHTTLRKPPKTFVTQRRREAGWAFKKENDGILNVARRYKYERDDDAVAMFVSSSLDELASRLSDDAKEIMCLSDDHRYVKRPHIFKKSDQRTSRLYTLAALFLHPQGYARQRPDTGALPGIDWLKTHVLHFSPFHFRGGIARSNLKWHAFRNSAIEALGTRKAANGKVLSHYDFSPEQHVQFRQHRRKFMKAVSETMQTMRDMVQERMEAGELAFKN